MKGPSPPSGKKASGRARVLPEHHQGIRKKGSYALHPGLRLGERSPRNANFAEFVQEKGGEKKGRGEEKGGREDGQKYPFLVVKWPTAGVPVVPSFSEGGWRRRGGKRRERKGINPPLSKS